MKELVLLLLLLFTVGQNLFAQLDFGYNSKLVSASTKSIIRVFDHAEKLEGERLGPGAHRSEIYPSFTRLKEEASLQELIELTRHKTPVTRCYAYRALLDRQVKKDTLFKIVKEHLKDTVVFKRQSGCIGGRSSVGDYMLDLFVYSEFYAPDQKELNEIDSLLFWDPENLIGARNEIFGDLDNNDKNYSRLKKIVEIDKDPNGLIALLLYNKPEDKKLIHEFISISPAHAFDAIRLFPEEEFIPDLKAFQKTPFNVREGRRWTNFYECILSYPNDVIMDLFMTPFNDSTYSKTYEQHARHMYHVLETDRSDSLLPLRFEVLKHVDDVSEEYLTSLWEINTDKTFGIIKDRFLTKERPYWRDNLINLIIDKVEALMGDSAIHFINTGIKKGNAYTCSTLTKRAKKYNDPETISILSDRFNNTEQNIPYLVRGIIDFDNKAVYEAIEEKVFDLLRTGIFYQYDYQKLIALGFKTNFKRCTNELLLLIEQDDARKDVITTCASELLKLKDAEINLRLVNHFKSKNAAYKKSAVGKSFGHLLKTNGLI